MKYNDEYEKFKLSKNCEIKEKDKKESFIAINDIFDENSSEDNFP